MNEIKVGTLLRDFCATQIDELATDVSQRRAVTFSASSETPVERFFGEEVLSHESGAVRMERVDRGAVPLLFNHNWDDPIGMVTGARLDKGRMLVDAAFFDTGRAAEVEKMIAGGLRNVSVGYRIHELAEDKKAGQFRVVDWEPLEISIVTVPADSGVGIGRAQDDEARPVRVRTVSTPVAPATSPGVSQMADTQTPAAGAQAASTEVQVKDNFDPAKYEAQRAETIRKLAASNDIKDERQVMHWVRSGKSWDEIADDILRVREERTKASPAVLGLTPAETQRFSIVRAVNACLNRDWSKAGFEAEVSRTTAQRMGRSLNEHTFIMPLDILQREMIVGTSSSGGFLVGTGNDPASFIDLLRNRSVAFRLGMRTLSGLSGPVTIPTQAASGSVGWLLESGTATESNMTVGQKTLSMKTVGGYQQFSRNLFMQSAPDVESLINADLAAGIALRVDAAVLAGTSTDQSVPLGIRFTSGLGTANPTSGTAVTYADAIRFQSTVAAQNALFDNFAYVTHPAIAAVFMGKPRFTNSDTPIWDGALLDGTMVGKRAMSSLQITSGSVLGGDFSQVILGEFGTVEIEANPYANFQAGIVGIRAFYSCDVLVRYGSAFAIGTGITG
jgi:HK97 family phage major capsid protein/HK97 family phage prohead protease